MTNEKRIKQIAKMRGTNFEEAFNKALTYWKLFDGEKQTGIVYGLNLCYEHYKIYAIPEIEALEARNVELEERVKELEEERDKLKAAVGLLNTMSAQLKR